jgi:hypothetical protein
VTTLNPDHLIEQAERLIVPPRAGPPRQVDLRRAISSAYYAVFHCCLTAAADEFVGSSLRATSRYALAYRSINHRTLKDLCVEARKHTPPAKLLTYFPTSGFGANIQAFAYATIELQEKRHQADYNPQPRFRAADATLAASTARRAVEQFQLASVAHRKAFLTLLICPPR